MTEEQSYKEFREEVEARQNGKDYEDIKEEMRSKSEFMLELDNLPHQNHIWVDRGAKLTCEGASHPTHEVWKKK